VLTTTPIRQEMPIRKEPLQTRLPVVLRLIHQEGQGQILLWMQHQASRAAAQLQADREQREVQANQAVPARQKVAAIVYTKLQLVLLLK